MYAAVEHCIKHLAGRVSVPFLQPIHFFFPTGSHTAQVNKFGLLKKLEAALIVLSKALKEVILRRNLFHLNCTLNLSLGPYTIPT